MLKGDAPMDVELERVAGAAAFIRERAPEPREVGIILGTGLGGLAERIDADAVIPYGEIPHFPVSTVPSHRGRLILGSLGGKRVAALQGRFHLYEGYDLKEVVRPVRIFAALGAKRLAVTCATGGLNLSFDTGDLMLIKDHINLPQLSPLRGKNIEEWGPRFPDLKFPYSPRLMGLARESAKEIGVELREGVYVWAAGPQLETLAETLMLRNMGADAVGMSTVPEVIAAGHLGMEVLGIAVITNVHYPDVHEPITIEEVVSQGERAASILVELIERTVEKI